MVNKLTAGYLGKLSLGGNATAGAAAPGVNEAFDTQNNAQITRCFTGSWISTPRR